MPRPMCMILQKRSEKSIKTTIETRSQFLNLSHPDLTGSALLSVDDFPVASFYDASPFDRKWQVVKLEYIMSSRAAANSLPENYASLQLLNL